MNLPLERAWTRALVMASAGLLLAMVGIAFLAGWML